MSTKFNVNGLNCYLSEIWGDLDDIQFSLVDASGSDIEDEEVYQYVENSYSDVLYDELYQQKVGEAEYAYDSLQDR